MSVKLQAGGTLNPSRHIYIERSEDKQILRLLLNREYVNVLSSRQMGKSSLIMRIIPELHKHDIYTAIIDLAGELGSTNNAEGYYLGLLESILRQLHLDINLSNWWRRYTSETLNQKFLRFFRDIVTTNLSKPVVIFLDEIDSTLKFSFTDDLFTAIRSINNERTLIEEYESVTFCLIGVAAPDELIKDRRTTPFNVGHTFELHDFDKEVDDLSSLHKALHPNPKMGASILDRILYWTGGHPYLTMRLCVDLSAANRISHAEVDEYVNRTFASLDRLSVDNHIQQILRFIEIRLSHGLQSLNIYQQILKGKLEKDRATLAHTELKLSGLVKRDKNGCLVVRNLIYQRLFNSAWVQNTHPKRTVTRYRRLGIAMSLALLLSIGTGIGWYSLIYIPSKRNLKPLALIKQAEEAIAQRDTKLAESLFKKSLEISEELYGPNSTKIVTILNQIARLYSDQGRFAEALSLYQRALLISRGALEPEPIDAANTLNNLAAIYTAQGRYGEAEPLLKEALQIREKVLGKEHPGTLTLLNNLALLYKSQGRYSEAEPLYKEALQLSERVLGKEHPDTSAALNNLALLYQSQGRYWEAEDLYGAALQLSEKVLGREHPDTSAALNNLALLYQAQGRYGEAEPLLKEALQIREKVLGKEHPSTLTTLNNLALLYQSQGRYSEAEPLYKEALQLSEKVLGREHPDTSAALNNLALLYQAQGRYGEAEPLLKEALQIREKVLGKQHPSTLTTLNNLALLYQSQGRYSEAEPLYKEALQLSEKVLGREHPDTLAALNNLASLYQAQGRYGEAEPLSRETLLLREKLLGKEHPHTISTLNNYIVLMINMGRNLNALRLLKQMESHLTSRSFQELYSTATDRVRRLYLKNLSNFQDVVFSFAASVPNKANQQYAANVMLRWKQVYEQESAFQNRLLHSSRDPEIAAMMEKLNRLRASLSRHVLNPESGFDFITLLNELNLMEQQIRENARKLKPELEIIGADLDQVLGLLPQYSAVIEYKIYRRMDFQSGRVGELRLAAYLLTSDIEAEQQLYFMDLGRWEEIFKAFNPSEKGAKTAYTHLLGMFDKQIQNLKTLFIAPDGFLNLISFAALRLPDSMYLVQHHQVNRILTGRDLLLMPEYSKNKNLIAFGGIDYGELRSTVTSEKSKSGNQISNLKMSPANKLRKFTYLPQSSFEVSYIAEIFRINNKSGKAIVYKGKQATEHRLKSLQQPPKILHLSTHSFFLGDGDLAGMSEELPLVLSGIALAGANHGLGGLVDEHGEDGLLTGIEVLGLNLQGTELVSLSGSDTGKGVVDYSEGVYGLVKAFRIAGARSVLMTIQSIADRSAKIFMEKFYEHLLSSIHSTEPSEALHNTRLYFITHPDGRYREPDFWSPYVVVGR